MHQQKYAYKLENDITETRCPVCKRYHLRMSQSGLITCRCGFICDNTHNYVAGVRLDKNKIVLCDGVELVNVKSTP